MYTFTRSYKFYNSQTIHIEEKQSFQTSSVLYHNIYLPYPLPYTYQTMISTPPTSTISRQFLFQKLILFNDDNMNDMNDDMMNNDMMNNDIDSPEQYSVTGFTCGNKNRRRKSSRKYTTSLEVIQEEEGQEQEREAVNETEDDDENENDRDDDDDAFSLPFSPIDTNTSTTTTDFCLSQRRMKKSKSVASSLSSLLFTE